MPTAMKPIHSRPGAKTEIGVYRSILQTLTFTAAFRELKMKAVADTTRLSVAKAIQRCKDAANNQPEAAIVPFIVEAGVRRLYASTCPSPIDWSEPIEGRDCIVFLVSELLPFLESLCKDEG